MLKRYQNVAFQTNKAMQIPFHTSCGALLIIFNIGKNRREA
jgi:hypothetical protein